MRIVRMRRGETVWSHRLYIVPENFKEKVYLYYKGYRLCKTGMITKGRCFVHEKHNNHPDE